MPNPVNSDDDAQLQPTEASRPVFPAKSIPANNTSISWLYSTTEACDEETWLKRTRSDLKHQQHYLNSNTPVIAVARINPTTGSPYLYEVELKSTFLRKRYLSVSGSNLGVSIHEDRITFQHPFQPLFFYLDKMRTASSDDTDKEKEDLEALVNLYDRWIRPIHENYEARFESGVLAFQDLWALFRPGELVVSKNALDEPRLHEVYPSDTSLSESKRKFESSFNFDCRGVEWGVAKRKASWKMNTFNIRSFQGTRKISSLPYIPLRYVFPDQTAKEKLMAELETRGRLWVTLISGHPVCRQYSGPGLLIQSGFENSKINVSVRDRVMVDNDGPQHTYLQTRSQQLLFQNSHLEGVSLRLDGSTYNMDSAVAPSSKVPDRELDGELSAHEAMMCPSMVSCFALSSRTWFSLSVSNMSLVEWKGSAWDHLVVDTETKDTVKALVSQHRAQSDENQLVGDVIDGKGNGLVVLIHGPPGVGKTLTAESVAEYTKRPLYSINIGEVTSEERVRERLQQIFAEASKWNAVLLLDEADVVLEKRSFEDIRRNGTVSIFLRMLEYYQGILFLTTNRALNIDEAFHSRIHLAYEYKTLDMDKRQTIWSNFINQLPGENTELKQNLKILATHSLNGREIRNILFTARSLAQGENEGLKLAHVNKMIDHAKKFQRFFRAEDEGVKTILGSMTSSPPAWTSSGRF